MKRIGYPAARAVAGTVNRNLAAHAAAARERGVRELAPLPDESAVERIVDAAFWASLKREEGQSPKISLAFVPPDRSGHPMVFERPLPLRPRDLARLAPAVERPGIHLGVWEDGGDLRVWGTTRSVPTLCFVLEVVEPGLLVVKYRRGDELDKFGTVAVIEADRIKVVDPAAASLPDCPSLLASLLGFDVPPADGEPASVLVQLATSMRAHRHGGSLLVVPEGSDAWRESAAHPLLYAVEPFREIPALLRAGDEERRQPVWREAFRQTVEAVAGLTAVDGATVLDGRYRVLAFGVRLVRMRGSERVERVALTEPVLGDEMRVVDPSTLGGTRHLSAAQFVYDQRDALALVASQDGRFTVFAWSPCEAMVHAHRVDALLM
ncbi:MAG TPA: hypothetical protein VF746_22265 [Longimicrobium sp.]|jgi:hypothetical protein